MAKKLTAEDVDLDKREEGVMFLVAEGGFKTACKVSTATYCATLRAVREVILDNPDSHFRVWRMFEGAPGSEKLKAHEEEALRDWESESEKMASQDEDEGEEE